MDRYLDNSKKFTERSCKLEVSQAFEAAGINTDMSQPYSIRAASATKAFLEGVSIQRILVREGWKSETFREWYLKSSAMIPKLTDTRLEIEEAIQQKT